MHRNLKVRAGGAGFIAEAASLHGSQFEAG